MPNELILHNYDFSNYAEKARLALGYKRMNWRSVIIPPVAPKPNLTPLTGGYRRTPVLQIGADIYCDTKLILRQLERLQPEPTMYPEEFSGRFFTPDKDLAKWYAMRQGTLTGKVKKLKLTEKEIKAAQEFAEKNLDTKYGEDLLVSKELAEKATVDLPATALAKIEAVIRKAKGIGPFLHKTHKQKDKINPKIPFVKKAEGGLAEILGV